MEVLTSISLSVSSPVSMLTQIYSLQVMFTQSSIVQNIVYINYTQFKILTPIIPMVY